MVARLDISAPAKVTVRGGPGNVFSAADAAPAFSIDDPVPRGTVTVTEAMGTVSGVMTISAHDPAVLPAATAIAVSVAPDAGPAFANPPATLTLQANALDALPGLIIGDPQVDGLIAAGMGAQESMAVTLAAASGIMLLPGFSPLDGISASGLGTGTIVLDFTADRLAAVNNLLAGLEFAGPAAQSGIAYSLCYIAGPLPAASTSGNIALNIAGPAGKNGTFANGNETLILGLNTLNSGQTLAVTGTLADLGGLAGGAAVDIAPDAALDLPYNDLSLGGTSLDLGTLAAQNFNETGILLIAESATFGGAVSLAPGAVIDFSGNLVADAGAAVVNQLAVSLGAGAMLAGDGTLYAGNFSEAGRITGPGTIWADPGDTILIAAGSIGGGANLDVAAGGVMILGPVSPLYGVFNPTPLTIDNSVTLAFSGTPGLTPIAGGYGDALAQSGGVFVISGPQAFAGTITGFLPGDRLIFPGLTNIALFNITANSFSVAGQDSNGNPVQYSFYAPYPAGASVYAGVDNEGDAEIGLRLTATQIYFGGTTIALTNIEASSGFAQPLQGLSVLLTASSTHTLTLTLSVAAGVLSGGTFGPDATLVINAPNATALDADLAALSYTGTGHADILTIASSTGVLAGLSDTVSIIPIASGTVAGFGPNRLTEGETALFASPDAVPQTVNIAAGEIIVSALNNFASELNLGGISGTALDVDAGAMAIFDAAAMVQTGADVTVGDAGGAGTIAIITDQFTVGAAGAAANFTLGGAGAAGSAADVSGDLGISGALVIGGSAALSVDGTLGAASTTLARNGTLTMYHGGVASLGAVTDMGSISIFDQAIGSAGTIALSGLLELGGDAALNDTGGLAIGAGTLEIGPDAAFTAAAISMMSGTILDAGSLAVATLMTGGGYITLAGGTIAAGALTIGPNGTLDGAGILVPATALLNKGSIIAAGGLLMLDGVVKNTGAIGIAAGATLDAGNSLNGNIGFSGTAAELIINDTGVFSAAVLNFAATDIIDLIGVAPSLVGYTAGSIAVGQGSTALGGFSLGTASGQPAVSIVSDGAGGTLITLGDEMPCFARGTRLLTPNGYRPVEALKPGDALVTGAGDRRAIRWIGRRILDFSGARAQAARPVVIAAGAFGKHLPTRPLRLSPLHAVFVDGVLVPLAHLVNGATICLERGAAAVTYYHVELDRHDVVLAEGLSCETYLDTGNRGALYHEAGERVGCRLPCALRVTSGARLWQVRKRLHDIALEAGFSLTYQPSLRAIADDHTMLPEIVMHGKRRIARFALPRRTARLTLLSRAASPAETDPASEDRRELAVCLAPAKAGTRSLKLGPGWLPRAREDAGVWMGSRAELLLNEPSETLTLSLAAIIRTWRPPGSVVGL